MKMINSSYLRYSEDCWYYHLNKSLLIKDGAHWYNQDIEVKFLGNFFILKTDMSNFPFDSNYTLIWYGRILAYAVHSLYFTVTRGL